MVWISSPRVPRSVGGLRVAAALSFLVAAGCHSLEVVNNNDPDLIRALAGGGDVQSLLAGGFKKWYLSLGDVAPSVTLDVASDHYESGWGNWGMRDLGWEPRDYPLINAHSDDWGDFREAIEEPWYNNYAALVSANLVLKALGNGVRIPGPVDSSANPMIRAAARFLQGAALSNIALDFDSGYAFDESYDPAGPATPLVGRDSVRRAALAKLDAAIGLASAAGANWAIPETFLNQIGEAWTAAQLVKAANYWAARTLIYFPHNATEQTSTDWAKVLSYASKGISSGTPFDLEIVGDGGTNWWWNDHMGIGTEFFNWIRVNVRVTCLLDPGLRCHRPNNGVDQPFPQSPDYRFNGSDVVGDNCIPQIPAGVITAADPGAYPNVCSTANGLGGADFVYLPTSGPTWANYPASRGYWRFSNLAFIRYFDNGWASWNYALGKLPFVLAAENDLIRAEALVRSGGSFATAAGLINTTRVGRGHLPALTGGETKQALLDAIVYERAIELFGAGPMIPWYDQRRLAPAINPHYYTGPDDSVQTGWLPYGKGLQAGTPWLLPVPDQELQVIGHNVYTYGGSGNPEPTAPQRAASIFGATRDGRVIVGPGRWVAIADSIIAANRARHRSLRRM